MKGYMIKKNSEGHFVEMATGIKRRTLTHGDNTVSCEFHFDRGAVIPSHNHIYEQTGYLITGELLFTIDGHEHEMHPGDSWCIKANVEHSAQVLEDTVLVEVFSPVREDYL
jgi:quercetin dioxygenase-like cupin family protein